MIRTVCLSLSAALALSACGLSEERTAPTSAFVPSAHASLVHGSPDVIADVAEATVPAVVHIASTRTVAAPNMPPEFFFGPFGAPTPHGDQRDRQQQGQGSGVLIGAEGLILTNNHVVEGASELVVTLSDGRTFDAEIKGTDPATDLALVQLQGELPLDLPFAQLGRSSDLRLGEIVLAIGNPFGLTNTVTMGIVSAMGRSGTGITEYDNFIQTDAAINPGNSGGALVNLRGEVVGINTAIFSRSGGYQGIGFSIPADMASQIVERLRADGKVVRGWLGVGIQDLDPRLSKMFGDTDLEGALVTQVMPDSPAARGGVRPGDVITDVDGEPIEDVQELRRLIALKGVGKKVKLDLRRERRDLSVAVLLGTLEAEGAAAEVLPVEEHEASGPLSGVKLEPLTPELAQQLGVDVDEGVVVIEVPRRGAAAEAGLQRGDVIVEVGGRPARSVEQLQRLPEGEGVPLLVARGGGRRFVYVD